MLHWGSWVFIRLGWCLWTTGLHNVMTCQTSLKSWWLMGKKLDGRVLQNCHLHMDETFVCHIFYKQISCPKCMKLTKFMSWEGNPERSHTFLVESWAKNFRLIPSQKTLGSWDFAKSCLGNPGIENSWSRWGLFIGWLIKINQQQKLIIRFALFSQKKTHRWKERAFISSRFPCKYR